MEELRARMREVQDDARYEHTLAVAYTAACLASLYGADTNKALIAGLLHDCAKCIPHIEQLRMCEEYGIDLNETEKKNHALLHAKLGAYLAKEKYGVADEEILSAIQYHTTGRGGMSMLEKIIFVADYIEPGRRKAANLLQIRRMAFQNIDSALIKILKDTLIYLEDKGDMIDSATRSTLAYYTEFI